MLKLKIVIGGQVFEFEGEAPFADVFTLAGTFFAAVLDAEQARINDLADRFKASTDSLSGAVAAAHPSTK